MSYNTTENTYKCILTSFSAALRLIELLIYYSKTFKKVQLVDQPQWDLGPWNVIISPFLTVLLTITKSIGNIIHWYYLHDYESKCCLCGISLNRQRTPLAGWMISMFPMSLTLVKENIEGGVMGNCALEFENDTRRRTRACINEMETRPVFSLKRYA